MGPGTDDTGEKRSRRHQGHGRFLVKPPGHSCECFITGMALRIDLFQDVFASLALDSSKRRGKIKSVGSDVEWESSDREGPWLRWELRYSDNEKYSEQTNRVLCRIERAQYLTLFLCGKAGVAAVSEREIEDDMPS